MSQKVLSGYLVLLSGYWLFVNQTHETTSVHNYLYSFFFSLIPLVGGVVGVMLSRPWGVLQSAIGRAIFFISLGLVTWGAGSMVWSYYNFVEQIAAPYPSIADLGFVLSLPLWAVGVINLSKATGASIGLRQNKGKAILLAIPLIVILISYYLLVTVARDGVLSTSWDNYLKLFFDLAYPLGDVVILALALIIFGLSFKYFGGKYLRPILAILVGFGAMYFADFVFSITTTQGTFYNGNFGDLLFTVALFLITFGILGFEYKSD